MTTEEKVDSIVKTLEPLVRGHFESAKNLVRYIVMTNEDKSMGWLQRACRNALIDEKRREAEFPIPRSGREGGTDARSLTYSAGPLRSESSTTVNKAVEVWEEKQRAEKVREAVSELTTEERLVIEALYFDRLSRRVAAPRLGLSAKYFNEVHDRALAKLKGDLS